MRKMRRKKKEQRKLAFVFLPVCRKRETNSCDMLFYVKRKEKSI